MFGHMPELLIILVIALIVFGPEKLPEVAANAGKMVREVRSMMHEAMNPDDYKIPDDFSSYFHESLARSGEEVPTLADPHEGANGAIDHNALKPDTAPVAEAHVEDAGGTIDLHGNGSHEQVDAEHRPSGEGQTEHPA
jgi:TatA/E family protein of Tat protein translocase